MQAVVYVSQQPIPNRYNGYVVRVVRPGPHRGTIPVATESENAACRSDRKTITAVVTVRTGDAIHGHVQVDNVWSNRAGLLVAQSQPVHRARRVVVRNDIGRGDQPQRQVTAVRVLQIQTD